MEIYVLDLQMEGVPTDLAVVLDKILDVGELDGLAEVLLVVELSEQPLVQVVCNQ